LTVHYAALVVEGEDVHCKYFIRSSTNETKAVLITTCFIIGDVKSAISHFALNFFTTWVRLEVQRVVSVKILVFWDVPFGR
jgi:hypothetical protein